MPFERLDRSRLRLSPLSERRNRVSIQRDAVSPDSAVSHLDGGVSRTVALAAQRITDARKSGKSVMLSFGAHTIKNGLAPVLIRLMERGWVTHLATNGAGIIHDWEFAFAGESSEEVRASIASGIFGAWQETGFYLNLALLVGAYRGLGYGESVGSMIEKESLEIPDRETLVSEIGGASARRPYPEQAAAAADLLCALDQFQLPAGRMDIPHRCKSFSAQAAAYRLGIPFTGHPMIGQDIIYIHPLNSGAAMGRTGLRDFLTFAHGVRNIGGGVYLSVGSAVMSPMIFEKSMSMAQNLAIQAGHRIEGHLIVVVDLAESSWDWSAGEPPQDHPDYYLRYYKTFHRMGGEVRYARADNRDFLLALCHALAK